MSESAVRAKAEWRWLFADQLGPNFLDDPDQHVLMIESQAVFARRRFHRQKAHLVLSAMRHRAAELGGRVSYEKADTYLEALARLPRHARLSVCQPTSWAADRFVRALSAGHLDGTTELSLEVLPARGHATSQVEFADWARARGSRRLLMEDFYRSVRRRLGVLMDGERPCGDRWNFDADNREPPPPSETLQAPEPWWPDEDEIDAEVRSDLDQWERSGKVAFVGVDRPRRFAVTRAEAIQATAVFMDARLPLFGAHEDAMLAGDQWMAHSLLSAPLNLGLLDPLELAREAEGRYHSGEAPLASVEAFVRQVIGWRDYMWLLYWHLGDDYRRRNGLLARRTVPRWFAELDPDGEVQARCLSDALRGVRENGWAHHIQRLMVLGNYAMQRGWRPDEVTDWFHRSFVDGYDWVMVPNVVGMSQYADGGLTTTKPYAAGGSYINTMSDYCGSCRYSPTKRTGPDACPFSAGYWWFLDRNAERLQGNPRIARQLSARERLRDLDEVVAQEERRGSTPP